MEQTATELSEKSFGRRKFLQGSAVLLGAAATTSLVGCNSNGALEEGGSEAEEGERVFRGSCRGNCGSVCSLNVTVREGKVVKTTPVLHEGGHPSDNRGCVRSYTHLQRIYAENRLKYPMRRKEGTARGAGEWEQITWDEAINEIATKWQSYIDEFGPRSISFNPGNGASGLFYDYVVRLESALHATHVFYPCDQAVGFIHPQAFGYTPYYSGFDPKLMMESKKLFFWGTNATGAKQHSYSYITDAVRNGMKTICVDTQFSATAAKSDEYHIVRPGTDAPVVMAMINIVAEEGLIDIPAIQTGTVGPFLVVEAENRYLRMSDLGVEPIEIEDPYTGQPMPYDAIAVCAEDGTIGSVDEIENPVISGTYDAGGIQVTTAYDLLLKRCAEWTPERASVVANIPVESIYHLAHEFADGPTCIQEGSSMDHYSNGGAIYHALTALVMITGNFGKPGAGWVGPTNLSLGVTNAARQVAEGGAESLAIWETGESTLRIFSPRLLETVRTGKYGDIDVPCKSMYIYANNFVRCYPSVESWMEVFDGMEFIVVADCRYTETVQYADLVLPTTHYFEQVEVNVSSTPYTLLSEQGIEPAFESKCDKDIVDLIAEAMGIGDAVTMSIEDYVNLSLDTETARGWGITWESLQEKKAIYSSTDNYVLGGGSSLLTATGRAQFYFADFKPITDYGCVASGEFDALAECLPNWYPPLEAWPETVDVYEKHPLAEKYPIVMYTRRSRLKCHTQFTHCEWLLEVWPEPFIYMSVEDAEARGIATEDAVKVYNDRGYMVCKAVVTPGLKPGQICQDHGWTREQFIDGCISDLLGLYSHPVYSHAVWFDTLCQIEKA